MSPQDYSQIKINEYANEKNKKTFTYLPSENPSFKEKLKSGKMNPDKNIMYGQNQFARDSVKKRIFVQSTKMPDGILVKYKDILSFELIRDGETIAGTHTDCAKTKTTQKDLVSSNEDYPTSKVYCSELTLKITIKDEYNPVIVMPFIFYPINIESDYFFALNAAQEIAKIINEILLLNNENAKGQKTSLDI